VPYQWLQNKTLPADAPAGGAPLVELLDSTLTLKAVAADHFYIDTQQDGKNVRINSRNVTQAAGDHTGVSIKPSKSADGSGGLTGLEVSPRFQAGMGGNDLRAILGDPVLKAGSGDIAAQVVAFEANLDFGVSGTRTITGDVSAFSSFLAVPSTYTYSGYVSFLRVRDVNVRGWDCFLNLDSANTGVSEASDKASNAKDHTLKVRVGTSLYHIQLYAN